MIPKRSRAPIEHFPRSARVVFRNTYTIGKTAPNGLTYNRVGVVVSKKVSRSAVARNYIKRRILDFFRSETSFLKEDGEPGIDLLVIVNPSMIEVSTNFFIKELKRSWEDYSTSFYIDHS
jgi:ribonuclease P protein component